MTIQIQRLFFAFGLLLLPFCAMAGSALVIGQTYNLKFTDVDGRALSTADGHVTVVAVTTRADLDKARLVGDRIPQYCLGDPAYRMITMIAFKKNPNRAVRFFYTGVIRRRLDAEAQRLKPRYLAKKMTRDPRPDLYAVADFDGTAAAQIGFTVASARFIVLAFARNGELLRRWDQVPSTEDLATVLK
jgi:hypothetical protein